MKKPQWLVIVGTLLLFAVLYWGFDNTTTQKKTASKRSEKSAVEDASSHQHSLPELNETQKSELALLESSLDLQQSEAAKLEAFQKLSGWWFRNGSMIKSGDYAIKAAELSKKDAAWSIAGATFHQALMQASDAAARKYCASQAIKAFEMAQSLNPDEVEHQVNLALIYAEAPPEDNPMKAVLMLRDLEQKYPNAPAVYNALGRLALRTNQIEKALQRLEKAISIDPKNKNTICLLAQAYEAAGQTDKANVFAKKCQ